MRLIPLREITTMQLMIQLTEKEEWDRKVRTVSFMVASASPERPKKKTDVIMKSSPSESQKCFHQKGMGKRREMTGLLGVAMTKATINLTIRELNVVITAPTATTRVSGPGIQP